MNKTEQQKFRDFVRAASTKEGEGSNREYLRQILKTGERGLDAKEANYCNLAELLPDLKIDINLKNVQDAAAIAGAELGEGYVVQVSKPPDDSRAARELVILKNDSSAIQMIIGEVDVRLDNDQLKHQHKSNPIGNRQKGGGNRFNDTVTGEWHKKHTLRYMAQWAAGLDIVEGQKQYHGQATPVAKIHYEGYCLLVKAKRYVLFHCYPSNDSDLRGPNA